MNTTIPPILFKFSLYSKIEYAIVFINTYILNIKIINLKISPLIKKTVIYKFCEWQTESSAPT